MDFRFEATALAGMYRVRPFHRTDARGDFWKWYDRDCFAAAGFSDIDEHFLSISGAGVLRGLHIQPQHPQCKLVYPIWGRIFDVGVDLRPGSPSYGRWAGVELDGTVGEAVFLPAGFAHGFVVRSESAAVGSLCQGAYAPAGDGGIRWDDRRLAIDWGKLPPAGPILSDRDRALPTLTAYERRWLDGEARLSLGG